MLRWKGSMKTPGKLNDNTVKPFTYDKVSIISIIIFFLLLVKKKMGSKLRYLLRRESYYPIANRKSEWKMFICSKDCTRPFCHATTTLMFTVYVHNK